MRKLLATSILITSAGFMTSATAEPVNWNTTTSGTYTCTSGFGNSCTFTSNGQNLSARAYATTGPSKVSPFEAATLQIFSQGLGVNSLTEKNSSPQHALDNDGRNELIIFEHYSSNYLFTGFQVGWFSGGSDLRVWVGGSNLGYGYDFSGIRFSELDGLGFIQFDFSNVGNTPQSLGDGITGPYLIISPPAEDKNDYVKISQISGAASGTPPAEIPEPGTLMLLAIALLGLAAGQTRRTCNAS
jgi:hypothetical protein